MNYSKQREILLGILKASKEHPTAQDIYNEMRRNDPKISLGTVYRNLSLLVKNGTVLRIDTDHDSVHYDGCTKPHPHFICDVCGRVYDLPEESEDLDSRVEEENLCKVRGHSLIFYGTCHACLEQDGAEASVRNEAVLR